MSTSDTAQRQFPCRACGANLLFEPGQVALKCPYCQAENEIAASGEGVEELDFQGTLARLSAEAPTRETLTVKCTACGAESSLLPDTTADRCPFCGSAIVAQAGTSKTIRPKSLLPFHITREQAMGAFVAWVGSLWFTPSDLGRFADANAVKGVYIPYWTYDCDTESDYRGERGDDYWDTEHYTAFENGKTVSRTRQVRRTRWRSVSGRVFNTFDDVLVLASNSLPRKYTEKLEPWDLGNLAGYRDEYLAGFVAESYQVGLEEGFDVAKGMMEGTIRAAICRDIGGDHQRIHAVDTRYEDITFKHILLPLWISAYFYRNVSYRFLVNARTGEVSGERPYSFWKIFLLVMMVLMVIAGIVMVVNMR
jgi:DNA-directed RNA polymerase subunit RPC12/RpoP